MYIRGIEQKRGILIVDDNFAILEKIDPPEGVSNVNKDFYFKFFFKVSQSRAIDENAFSVVVTLKTKNKQVPIIVSNQQKIDAAKIVNNILTHKLKIKKQNSDQKSSILIEKVADISSKIDNRFLTLSRSNVVDESQFAKTTISLRKKNDIDDVDLDYQSNDTLKNKSLTKTLFGELAVVKNASKNSGIAAKKRFKLLNSLIPPSSITSTSNKTMTPHDARIGCISPLPKNNFRNQDIDALSAFHHLEEIHDEKYKKEKNEYETVITQSFNDLINVNLNLILKESFMYQPYLIAEFKLVKNVINSRNETRQVVVETVQKSFDMKYYYDIFMEDMKPLSVGISKRNQETFLQIKNQNGSACNAIIYAKSINDFNKSSFKQIATTTLGSKNEISTVKIIDSDRDAIYRIVCSSIKTKQSSLDFTDVVIKNQRKISNNNVVVIPFLNKGKINLSIINNSYDFNIVACKILYRNATKKESKYTIASILPFTQGTNEYDHSISASLIPYNIYEITTKLIFENGIEVYSTNSNFVEFIPYNGSVYLNISGVSSSANDIAFNLNAQILEDQIQQISTMISQVSATYNIEEYQTRQASFDKFIAYQIYRYDFADGTCSDLGIIPNASSFSDSDQSLKMGAKKATSGEKYKYIIYPLVRDPETITETKKEFIDVETKKRYTSNLRKSRHPVALIKGSVLSKHKLDSDSKRDMSYGILGQSYSLDLTAGTTNQLTLINNFSANLISDKKVILTWNVSGRLSAFDHILIFKDEGGVRTIIGKTHCFEDKFTFTYNLTKQDIGNIQFVLVPIHQDYSSGRSVISNYVLINDVE